MTWLGPLCAFGSSVTWALGSSAYSKLSRENSPFAVNFSRALVALPLFVIATFAYFGWTEALTEYRRVSAEHWAWFGVGMVASYGLADGLFLWSTAALGVPGALAIASCYPIWTALVGVFEGQGLSLVQGAGLVIAIAGIIAVVLNGPRDLSISSARAKGTGVGVALAIGTSLLWAVNSYVAAHAGGMLPPTVGNTLRMSIALVLCASFGRVLDPDAKFCLPARSILRALPIFAFEAFGGSLIFLYGLGHTSLALGSTLSALAPVISVPIALAMGLERFSLPRALGVVTAVAGLCLLMNG